MPSNVIASGKAVLIGSFISKGISIVSSTILARLLFEKDYGAMVLAAIFGGLITQIGGMGYELYYLQHKGNEAERRKVLEQVYNLRLVTNIIMFMVQGLIGLFLFAFTNNKMSGGILMLMAVSLVVEGFNAPQETLLKDQMEFRKITIGNIFKEFFATVGKVSAAFLGFGGYSFGVGPIMGSLVRLVYLRKVQPYKHAYFEWDKVQIKEIFNFGKHVLFGSAAMYLVQQVDRIFLTIFFPQNIVGRYGFAWSNASMPFNYLVMPQAQLTVTYVSKYSSEGHGLFNKLNLITRIISLIFIPLITIATIFTSETIKLIFTEKWLSVTPIVFILLLYYLFLSITFPYAYLLTGLGYPKDTARITIFKAIALIVSLFFIGYFLKVNIQYYTLVFVIISIIFDIAKMFSGIIKLNLNLNTAISLLKYEIILVLLVTVLSVFSQIINLEIIKLLTVFILFFLYLIAFFIFDVKKTILAIQIVSPRIANLINKLHVHRKEN